MRSPASEPIADPSESAIITSALHDEPYEVVVSFDLPLPVEEHSFQIQGSRGDFDDEYTIEESAPVTIPFDRDFGLETSETRQSFPSQWGTHGADYEGACEAREPSYDAMADELAALGPIDDRPDREVERWHEERIPLARARTLRFHLAMREAWPIGRAPRPSSVVPSSRVLHPELVLSAAMVASIADGALTDDSQSIWPMVEVLSSHMLAYRSDLSRAVFRDRGASILGRFTMIGFQAALDEVKALARPTTADARQLALEIATCVATIPPVNTHRLGVLHDLEGALGLPSGASAQALDTLRLWARR
ncbi:MAG: hypothetical protein NVS3B20_26600 [Polyangiales bacterium]